MLISSLLILFKFQINSPYYKVLQPNKTYHSSRNTMTVTFCSQNISNRQEIDIQYKAGEKI